MIGGWVYLMRCVDWSTIVSSQVFAEKGFEVSDKLVAVFGVGPLLQEVVGKHFIENCLMGNILIITNIGSSGLQISVANSLLVIQMAEAVFPLSVIVEEVGILGIGGPCPGEFVQRG